MVDPSDLHYPFDKPIANLTLYDVDGIMDNIRKKKKIVVSCAGKKANFIHKFLPIDPNKYLIYYENLEKYSVKVSNE